MKFVCLLLLLGIVSEAWGYNSYECNKLLSKKYGLSGQGMAVYTLGNYMTSTSQYITSTGRCAAFGSIEQKREVFFVFNYEHLKSDIAKGNGEYLDNLFSLFDCQSRDNFLMKRNLKREYRNIFSSSPESSKEIIFSNMNKCNKES